MEQGILAQLSDPEAKASLEFYARRDAERERLQEAERYRQAKDQQELGATLTLILSVELGEEADARLKETAANTEAYARDFGRFRTWCASERLPALPSNAETLSYWLIHLAGSDNPPSLDELARVVAAITEVHRIQAASKPGAVVVPDKPGHPAHD
jgi:hypothetical protein